jgi:hypothetical protein
VLYDSWPVPALEQFRDDPEYARNIPMEDDPEQVGRVLSDFFVET